MGFTLGIAAVLTSPLARMYGKRPVFLASLILCIISYSIILAKPTSMTYIWVGRALWGFGSGPIEYLWGQLTWPGDCGAGRGGPELRVGIRYAVIFASLYTIILFFLAPETTFKRAKKFDNDVHEVLADEAREDQSDSQLDEKADAATPAAFASKETSVSNVAEEAGEQGRERPETYVQSLKVYRGRFSKENYLRGVLSPLAVLLLPGVAWAAYCYSTAVAFSLAISVSLSGIFSVPPYNFTTGHIGLIVLSPFIGDLIGNLVPGPVSDKMVVFMSRRNNGVYEPEFRILLVIPAFFIGLAGFWGFGLSIHYRTHWMGPVFCFGLSALAGQVVSLISNSYLLDCHRKYAQDAYAVVSLAKGVLTFAATFFMSEWLKKSGTVEVFYLIGMIHGIACVWGLILYVYGKRIRLAVHNSAFINKTMRFCGNKE